MDLKLPDPGQMDGASTRQAMVDKDGILRCYCGRRLMKIDETTYQCDMPGPLFRMGDEEFVKDKYGNLYLKEKPH